MAGPETNFKTALHTSSCFMHHALHHAVPSVLYKSGNSSGSTHVRKQVAICSHLILTKMLFSELSFKPGNAHRLYMIVY